MEKEKELSKEKNEAVVKSENKEIELSKRKKPHYFWLIPLMSMALAVIAVAACVMMIFYIKRIDNKMAEIDSKIEECMSLEDFELAIFEANEIATQTGVSPQDAIMLWLQKHNTIERIQYLQEVATISDGVAPGRTSKKFAGMTIDEVKAELIHNGFPEESIRELALPSNKLKYRKVADDTVLNVKINGKTNYKADQHFLPNKVSVEIQYHVAG